MITVVVAAVLMLEPRTIEPTRVSGYKGIIGELEDRMPLDHAYRDKNLITWAHETTHGLNSRLRMANRGWECYYVGSIGKRNGCYYRLKNPRTMRLSQVYVPPLLEGKTYKTYLGNRSWDDNPLYLLDEWVAYTNGTICLLERPVKETYQSEPESMMELMVYSWCMLASLDPKDKDINLFVRLASERSLRIWAAAIKAGIRPGTEHIKAALAEPYLIDNLTKRLGKEWCKLWLGI